MCIEPGQVIDKMLDLLGTKNSILSKGVAELFDTAEGYKSYQDKMMKQFDRQIEELAELLKGILVKQKESIDWDALVHSFLP